MNPQVHRTTAAGGVSGALVTLLMYVGTIRGTPITADVAIAMTTIATAGFGYFFRYLAERGDRNPPPPAPARPYARPIDLRTGSTVDPSVQLAADVAAFQAQRQADLDAAVARQRATAAPPLAQGPA